MDNNTKLISPLENDLDIINNLETRGMLFPSCLGLPIIENESWRFQSPLSEIERPC